MFTRQRPQPALPQSPEKLASEERKEHSIHDLSLPELKAFHEQVGQVLAQRTAQAREDFRRDVLGKLELFGMSLDDFKPAKQKKERKPREPAKPKYQYGGHAWNGKGRTPLWLQELLAQGHQQDEFLIDGASPPATAL